MPYIHRALFVAVITLATFSTPAFGQMDNGAYVSGNYVGLLNRFPDPGGWIFQKTALDQGLPRDSFTSNFINSAEFAQRRATAPPYAFCNGSSYTFVQCLYEAGLHREGSPAEISGWASYPNIVAARSIIGSAEFALSNSVALRYRTDYVTPKSAFPTGNVTAGAELLLTVEYGNQYGVDDVLSGQIIINANTGPVNGSGACYIGWDYLGNLNLSYAANPTGTASVPSPTMVAPQCSIVPGLSSIHTQSGFRLTLAITFPAGFSGLHNIYSFGTNREGLSTPWTYLGQLNVTSTSANFALTAPSPQMVIGGVSNTARFGINVNGTVAGSVSFAASGVPPGATASFSPATLSGPGTTTLQVTTSAATPVGSYSIGVLATSGSVTRTTSANLQVTSSAPATLLTPAEGAILTGGPATFTWTPGVGVTQYQLLVGSTAGGAEYYSSTPGSALNVTAVLPTTLTRNLYVSVRSLIGSSWVTRTSVYSVGVPPPVQGTQKIATKSASIGGDSNYIIINNGRQTRIGPIYAQVTIGNEAYADNARTITRCGLSNSTGMTGYVTVPSDFDPFDGSSFDLVVSADSNTTPGLRQLTCQHVNGEVAQDPGNKIGVYDGGPEIDAVEQHPPAYAGGPFYITLWGRNFGRVRGAVNVCETGANQCSGTPAVSVNSNAAFSFWTDTQINVEVSPSPGTSGVYDIQITSLGATGLGFVPAPQGQSTNPNARGQFQVTAGTAAVQILRADVAADQVTVNVTATAGTTGELSVFANGPSVVNLYRQVVGSGNYNVSFNRQQLPLGSYTSVGATWTTPSGTASAQRSSLFKNLGFTRFSTYNVPNEMYCTGSQRAYIIYLYNSRGCQVYETTLASQFMSQVYINGTGLSNYDGVLKSWDAGSRQFCTLIGGMTTQNTFFATTSVTGQCNTALNDQSVAVSPGPRNAGSSWACTDRVVVVNGNNTTQDIKRVADRCPDCADPASFRGTQGHIDAFSTGGACSPRAFTDYGNFLAIQVK